MKILKNVKALRFLVKSVLRNTIIANQDVCNFVHFWQFFRISTNMKLCITGLPFILSWSSSKILIFDEFMGFSNLRPITIYPEKSKTQYSLATLA